MSLQGDLFSLEKRVEKLENTSVMFKYDNPMQGKVSPEGSGQITDTKSEQEAAREQIKQETIPVTGVWAVPNGEGVSTYATELGALRAIAVSAGQKPTWVPFTRADHEY